MDSTGSFVTATPTNELVGKYISYYYFHVSDDSKFSKNFFFYPNYKHGLTIYRGSDVEISAKGSVVHPSAENNISCFYSINTDTNLHVSLNGTFNKIGIVFNPLGLNPFVEGPLSEIFGKSISPVTYFGPEFEGALAQVFDEPDIDKKAMLLDGFFAQKHKGFNDLLIKKAVQEILNSNGSVRVEELSDALNVNRKTLLRLFKKHLCCSVEEYKKLVMFRNALNYSQQAGDASLTDVALYNLYYDQAHFIKHFKSVTKLPPKALLSKLTQLGSREVVYWHFED